MNQFVTEPPQSSNPQLIKRIRITKGDITRQQDVDAIVSSMTTTLHPGGSLNQALFKMAGQDFDDFILEHIYKPHPGDCYVVPGFNLPMPHVIFVIIPDWRDEFAREDVHLLRCYRHALKTAHNMKLKTIAFPALGTGHHGYPLERAARLAIRGIIDRLSDDIAEVRLVCDNDKTFDAFQRRLAKSS